MNLKNHFCKVTAVCVLACFSLAKANAQEDNDAQNRMQAEVAREIASEVAAMKKRHIAKFEIRIDEMDRVCDLDDGQVAKLKIASKGAISKSIAEYEKNMGEFLQQFGGGGGVMLVAPQAMPAQEAPAEEEPDQEVGEGIEEGEFEEFPDEGFGEMQLAQMGLVGNLGVFGNEFSSSPSDLKIWKDSVKKILTEQQIAAYVAYTDSRKQFKQLAAVQSIIASADEQMLFSPEQREQLVAHLNEKHGDLISSSQDGYYMQTMEDQDFSELADQMAIDLSKLDNDETLKAILSDSQFAVWNKSIGPMLLLIENENMNQPMGGGFAVPMPMNDDQ